MSTTGSPPPAHTPVVQSKCTLEPMDLHEQAQADELLRQRKLCGWNDTRECIDGFRDAMDARTKSLFWIIPTPSTRSSSQPGPQPTPGTRVRAGHISLDSEAHPPDLELANPHDRSVLSIATFYVLPGHRGGGLGRAAVESLERWAVTEPYGSRNCRVVALTTISRRYSEDDGMRAEYREMAGVEPVPRGASNEDWYLRMGYTKWMEAPLYQGPDGYKFLAAYLRKRVA